MPVAAFLGIWWIARRDNADGVVNTALALGAVLVLLDPLVAQPLTVTALVMALTVVVLVLRPPHVAHPGRSPPDTGTA